jgi:type III secretory pathway component EscR
MNYLKILYLFIVVFCNSTVAITPKEPCALEKQNVDKWQYMQNKSAKGGYQEYLHKRYQQAKVEYLQCLNRNKQNPQMADKNIRP